MIIIITAERILYNSAWTTLYYPTHLYYTRILYNIIIYNVYILRVFVDKYIPTYIICQPYNTAVRLLYIFENIILLVFVGGGGGGGAEGRRSVYPYRQFTRITPFRFLDGKPLHTGRCNNNFCGTRKAITMGTKFTRHVASLWYRDDILCAVACYNNTRTSLNDRIRINDNTIRWLQAPRAHSKFVCSANVYIIICINMWVRVFFFFI